jgi:hypothetical protein
MLFLPFLHIIIFVKLLLIDRTTVGFFSFSDNKIVKYFRFGTFLLNYKYYINIVKSIVVQMKA